MDVMKFLLKIKMLAMHARAQDIISAEAVGQSVVVGRILSVKQKVLRSAPLKCVCIVEEPPINCPNENKDLINVFLWNDFANVDLENCSIIGFKPEVVSKNGDQKLQACLGLDERRPGQMWIEGSARFTEKPGPSCQENVPAVVDLKEDCFCPIWSWFATPLLNDRTGLKVLKNVKCVGVSSFHLICKVLKVGHVRKNCSVLRVADGTLCVWPLAFFDRFGCVEINWTTREKYYVDILMTETDGIFQLVEANMFVKLYGVQVKQFEARSGAYHCFRASGDAAKFKILPETQAMNREIDRVLSTFVECERPRKLEIDSRATNCCCNCHLLKSDAVTTASGASTPKESSSTGEEFLVDRPLLSTPQNSCARKWPLQSGRVASRVKISGEESNGSASIAKVSNLGGRLPLEIATVPRIRRVEKQTEKAFNMFKAYKRPQNLDFDSRGACRRTLPKLAVSFHAGDLVYSIDMSRKEARSELKESGSLVVAPASLSTPDNGRAGKHPLRSGRVAEHMKIYGKESKGRAGVFKVVKVSGHKRTSQEAERFSEDSDKSSQDVNPITVSWR